MSYTALYRKWRPRVFEDVKGQDHIVKTLKNQIITGRYSHTYLFCGTRGTGKTTVAKIFAQAVNCTDLRDGSPCGECRSCRQILAGNSLNVVEMDAASNNGVDDVRGIKEQIQYPPAEGRYRVYIIDEVHMMSGSAFNAFLKTLEEPPSYVIFILATTDPNKIPLTVLSRCQRYDFKRITADTIVARLKELAQAEQMPVEERALRYVAKAGDGSMRDALSLLDQCAAFHFGETLTYEHVLDLLGAADVDVFRELFLAVAENRTKDCILMLDELILQGRELTRLVLDFVWYLRNLLLLRTAEDAEDLLDMSEENIRQLREDAKLVDETALMRYIRVLSDLSNQIRYASQKRVMVEVALIRLTRPQMEQNLDSVLERLSALEAQVAAGIPVRSAGENETDYVSGSNAQTTAAGAVETGHPAGLPAGSSGIAPLGNHASGTEPVIEPKTVEIPKAQLEDLALIRNEWGKIIREIGTSAPAIYRGTVVEPAGEGCLCIVFYDEEAYAQGSRATILGVIERKIKEKYGKEIYLKTRIRGNGERLDTRYVSEAEAEEKINFPIDAEET